LKTLSERRRGHCRPRIHHRHRLRTDCWYGSEQQRAGLGRIHGIDHDQNASKKAITKKQNMALNHTGNSSSQPNSAVPGSNGYSGSGKKPGKAGSPSTTLNSMQMNRKSTAHNNPNSVVPGSASYSGSAPKPAST